MSNNLDFKNASWDDIIFDRKNKEYGAYVLRKLIYKHTLRGFAIALSGFIILLLLLRFNIFS